MPFTAINVVNGTTPVNATWGNNAQVQYTEATLSFGPDFITAGFVMSGLVATKDGATANKLDVTAGKAYLVQTDGTTRQRTPVASSQTTSVINTTYYLFLNNDGTFTWGTTSSGPANSLPICQATTDASGNILVVTDVRPFSVSLLPGMTPSGVALPSTGTLYLPTAFGTYRTQNDQLAGIVMGGVTFGQVGALTPGGDNNGAALFNGTTGAVIAPATGLPTVNAAWTIEAIFKYTAAPAAVMIMASLGGTGSNGGAYLGIDTAGKLNGAIFGGVTTIVSAGVVSTNVYHHAALTWNGTTLTLYLDGASAGTATPAALALTSSGCSVGASTADTSWFSGTLDEGAFYSTALSAARITAHNSAITGGGYLAAVQTDTPLRYYRLGDAVGATVAADTVPAAASPLVDAGGGIAGLPSVGGQPTAGNFGVPVIVAQALDVHVTVVAQTTILTYTIPTTGNYRVNISAFSTGAGSFTPTMLVVSQGAHGSAQSNNVASQLGTVWQGTNAQAQGVEWGLIPVLGRLLGGSSLQVLYTPSASPNDFVSVIVERLA